MRYVAAYMLAVLGGNYSPSSKDIQKILGSVGIEANAENIDKVIKELKGKNLEEVMSRGREKLSSMPAAGGAPAAVAAAPQAAAAAAADKGADKKAKEPEPESEEEDDMGFGLFD